MPENNRLVPTPDAADLPSSTILIDGEVISATYRIVAISVSHEAHKVPEAKLVLLDGDVSTETFDASNADNFLPGKEIEIKAGYHGSEDTIFKGIIVKHGIKILQGQSSVLHITAKHKIFKTTLVRNAATFSEVKDSEVIEKLISENKEVDTTEIKHDFLMQPCCSDWDFINMRAEANGLFVLPKHDIISIVHPDLGKEPALTLYYGSSIIEFEADMDARNCFNEVKVSGWDIADQALIDGSTTNSWNSQGPGNFSSNDAAAAMKNETCEFFAQGISDSGELQTLAKSSMLRRHLSKTIGRVKCIGFAAIWPGDMLKLNGVGNRFNGNVFVSGVKHSIREGRWDTDIQFGLKIKSYAEKYNDIINKPANGHAPGIEGLQTGIVKQLASDPQNEYRVLVNMPTQGGNTDSIWARVCTLDAGKDRGSFFLPEVGDEVIIGFVGNDPLKPVMLGCVYSSNKPPSIEPTDENNVKGFYSREKMKWLFNDEKKEIRFETENGNIITISEDKKGISLQDENGNKIIMDNNGIEINSSGDIIIKAAKDIKGDGTNIELNATAAIKASGSAGAELSSSGNTEVKGSMVMIN